jgi:hypothetical protein
LTQAAADPACSSDLRGDTRICASVSPPRVVILSSESTRTLQQAAGAAGAAAYLVKGGAAGNSPRRSPGSARPLRMASARQAVGLLC